MPVYQDVKITGATIFTNPYQELEDEEKQKEAAAAKQVRRKWDFVSWWAGSLQAGTSHAGQQGLWGCDYPVSEADGTDYGARTCVGGSPILGHL